MYSHNLLATFIEFLFITKANSLSLQTESKRKTQKSLFKEIEMSIKMQYEYIK